VRAKLRTSAVLSLDVLRSPPRLCPFGQIYSDQDLGSLPQLNDVYNVLQRGDGEADKSDELWPGKALQQGKRGRDGGGDWCGHPVSEIECDKEEFVACADEEERCLVWGMHEW